MKKYGNFSSHTREYVITDPNTPAPWINYLFGRNLQAFISQAAGGCAWYAEPVHGRITRYRFNGAPVDSPGFYLYLREGQSIWNPSFFPVRTPLDHYECRHTPGYTKFIASKNGLAAEVTYFIPLDTDVMIWDVRLRNLTGKTKHVTLDTYQEYSLHGYDKDTAAFLVCGNQYRAWYDRGHNGIAVDYFAWEAPFMGKSFFTCSQRVTKYEIDRNIFFGHGRTEADPVAFEKGLHNSELRDGGQYACGVLETSLTLPPKGAKRILFALAISKKLSDSQKQAACWANPGRADGALKQIITYWNNNLAAAQVHTPDTSLNHLMNTWLPFNSRATFNLSRSISSRHTGSGDSLRFRDSMQDTMPATTFFPRDAAALIAKLYQTMLASGKTVTGVNAATLRTGDTSWTRIDAALWGVFTVYRYLAETGEYELLSRRVPFYDSGAGTILDHMIRGFHFIGDNDGPDGLPRIFNVDWNDMLVLFSGAYPHVQSIMVAQQFIYAARLMIEILEALGTTEGAEYLKGKIAQYTQVLQSPLCWDGRWFKRLVGPTMVMGSKTNREGKIFLNTQSWAVIAGTLDAQKCRSAMDSAAKQLATAYGLRLFAPPYTRMLDNKTPFHCNTPGAGENGGIFLHANTWAIMAEALLGNRDRAWSYFHRILPATLSDADPDRSANEPYAFTSWVYGPNHERFGNGQLSWLTGGASWIHTVGWEYILGIRPTLAGIILKPCTPHAWPSFTVSRRIRNVVYAITVSVGNLKKAGTPIAILLDGKPIEGGMVPYQTGKRRVVVKVTI